MSLFDVLSKGFGSLEMLDVAGNLIYSIENGTFASMPRLTTLHLEKNVLSDISPIYAPFLISVLLDGNIHLHQSKFHVSTNTGILCNEFIVAC